MNIINFFRRSPKNSKARDIKTVMIQSAVCGDFICGDFVSLIKSQEATDNQVPVILYALSRATSCFLKSLEESGIPGKRMYLEMLEVWFNDFKNNQDYFDEWFQMLDFWRKGID